MLSPSLQIHNYNFKFKIISSTGRGYSLQWHCIFFLFRGEFWLHCFGAVCPCWADWETDVILSMSTREDGRDVSRSTPKIDVFLNQSRPSFTFSVLRPTGEIFRLWAELGNQCTGSFRCQPQMTKGWWMGRKWKPVEASTNPRGCCNPGRVGDEGCQ